LWRDCGPSGHSTPLQILVWVDFDSISFAFGITFEELILQSVVVLLNNSWDSSGSFSLNPFLKICYTISQLGQVPIFRIDEQWILDEIIVLFEFCTRFAQTMASNPNHNSMRG